MAENEHISIGTARRLLRKLPNTPLQTYSSVLKKVSKTLSPSNSVTSKAASFAPDREEIQTLIAHAEIHHPPLICQFVPQPFV